MKRIYLILFSLMVILQTVQSQNPWKDYKKYMRCINQNDMQRLRELVISGVDINARDAEGKTPLLYALQQGKTNFAYVLLSGGADVHLADYKNNTCLHYAIENSPYDTIIYYLLEKGADFRAVNDQGYSPLHYSILYSCGNLPFYLINEKKADYYLITGLNENALHLSIESGCDTMSYFLLDNDIDIKQRDNRGNTPLLAALDFGRHDVALRLINMGADINEVNNNNFDALLLAVLNQDSVVVKLLLEKGAQIDQPYYQEPLVYIAADMQNAAILNQLLIHGADFSEDCTEHYKCFNTAYIFYINAKIATGDSAIYCLNKSLKLYHLAKEKFKKELHSIQAKNTGRFLLDVLSVAAASSSGTYYNTPTFDYEMERAHYLNEQVDKCDEMIDKIEKLLGIKNDFESPDSSNIYIVPDTTEIIDTIEFKNSFDTLDIIETEPFETESEMDTISIEQQ